LKSDDITPEAFKQITKWIALQPDHFVIWAALWFAAGAIFSYAVQASL